jgi:putative ABC transport system permease protein
VWIITVRDLQYRARQFAIAVAGAALVFAVTLILTGMSAGFRHEPARSSAPWTPTPGSSRAG